MVRFLVKALFGLRAANFSSYSHMVEGARVLSDYFVRAPLSSWSNYLPNAQRSVLSPWELGLQHVHFGGSINISTIACTMETGERESGIYYRLEIQLSGQTLQVWNAVLSLASCTTLDKLLQLCFLSLLISTIRLVLAPDSAFYNI